MSFYCIGAKHIICLVHIFCRYISASHSSFETSLQIRHRFEKDRTQIHTARQVQRFWFISVSCHSLNCVRRVSALRIYSRFFSWNRNATHRSKLSRLTFVLSKMWKNFDKGKCLKLDWTKKSNNIAVFGWLGLPIVGWQGRKGPSSWKAFVAPSASLWQKPCSIRWWRGPTSWGRRGSPTLDRYWSRFFVQAGHETTYASSGIMHFSLYQTYQNYKLGKKN